jgi:hypothetical protein
MMKKGDTVIHKTFGAGQVLEASEGKALVAFADGEKRISTDFLEFVAAGEDRAKAGHFERRYEGPLFMASVVRFSEEIPASVRSYQVSKWIRTKCPVGCVDFQNDGRCGHQSVFPLPYLVRLSISEDGRVARAACSEGRNGSKGACPDAAEGEACSHIQRAVMAFEGDLPDDDNPLRRFSCDLRSISSTGGSMPKCPNCGSSGMVRRDKNSFACHSGTCRREDSRGREQPYRFKPGDGKGKLKPRWSRIEVKEGYKWD